MSNKTTAQFIADDALSALSLISGTSGSDTIIGSGFDDQIDGLGGNDNLFGRYGNDVLNGGRGMDYLAGAYGDDRLSGGAGNDRLSGGAGADVLLGGGGNDRLDGGFESDTLKGGAGSDRFAIGPYQSDSLGNMGLWVDTIVDFSAADDQIELSWDYFGSLPLGALQASAFCANTSGTAEDSLDRIIYDTDTGELYFDADGSGAGAAVQFAYLKNHAPITAADIQVELVAIGVE